LYFYLEYWINLLEEQPIYHLFPIKNFEDCLHLDML